MSEELFDNILSLTDEYGNNVKFEFVDLIKYKGEEYVALLPCDDKNEEDGELVILEIEKNENDNVETYVGVEDDSVLEAVYKIFKKKHKDLKFLD